MTDRIFEEAKRLKEAMARYDLAMKAMDEPKSVASRLFEAIEIVFNHEGFDGLTSDSGIVYNAIVTAISDARKHCKEQFDKL